MKDIRALKELEQAVVQEMEDRHILEPLVREMVPLEEHEHYGICLCADPHHLKRRIRFYDYFFSGADRHPIMEHGGGASLGTRKDEVLWRHKFQEFLFPAIQKGTKFFAVETHLACTLVQDTWDIDPYLAVKRHHEGDMRLKGEFQKLVGNRDRQLELYLEYTLGAAIKPEVEEKFENFRPDEIEIFPVIDTYRIVKGKPLDLTYKLCRGKLLEHRAEMDQLVPAILSGDKKVA